MADKPTEDYLWAESAAGGDVADPAAKRSAGYLFEDPLPHEEFNYLTRALGRYVDWLNRSAGGFDYPAESRNLDNLAADDTFVSGFGGSFGGSNRGSQLQTTNANGWEDVCTDGEFIIAVETGSLSPTVYPVVHVFDPSGTTAERTFSISQFAPNVERIVCNGEYIAVCGDAAGGDFEVFDYDGNQQFTGQFDTGATVFLNDMDMDANRLYLAGNTGGAGNELQAWDLSTGTLDWSYAHGANLYGVIKGASKVYATGAANGTSETFIVSSTSGGAVAYTTPSASVDTTGGKPIAQTENFVFIPVSTTSVQKVNKFSTPGDQGSPFTLSNDLRGLAADERYVYAITTDEVQAFREDLFASWITSISTTAIASGTTTGQYVYILDETTSPFDMYQITTGRHPGIWRYTGTHTEGWQQWKFIPSPQVS